MLQLIDLTLHRGDRLRHRLALRSYSYACPAFVIDYVRDNANRLSPLTKREALKALLKTGAVAAAP